MKNNQLTLAAVSAAIFAIVWVLLSILIFPELPWAGGVVGGLAWFAAAFASERMRQ